MNNTEIFYMIIVNLILLYTVIDVFVKSENAKKIIVLCIYVPSAVIYAIYTIDSITSTKIQARTLEKLIGIANEQGNKLTSLINTSKDQGIKMNAIMDNAVLQWNNLTTISKITQEQEKRFIDLVKGEMVIRSFSIKVRYLFTSKTKLNVIRPLNWEGEAFLFNRQKPAENIKFVSTLNMKYPNENSVEITYDFVPYNHKDIINKPIDYLNKFDTVKLFYPLQDYIVKELKANLEPNYLVESFIYINGYLYHKYIGEPPNNYLGIIYFKKDGLFEGVGKKYLKLIGLENFKNSAP
jgi:hypothetical protein